MNIFILHEDPVVAAQMLCDRHVPKMIVESAQMLSTAHRLLDGIPEKRPSKSGKTIMPLFINIILVPHGLWNLLKITNGIINIFTPWGKSLLIEEKSLIRL